MVRVDGISFRLFTGKRRIVILIFAIGLIGVNGVNRFGVLEDVLLVIICDIGNVTCRVLGSYRDGVRKVGETFRALRGVSNDGATGALFATGLYGALIVVGWFAVLFGFTFGCVG